MFSISDDSFFKKWKIYIFNEILLLKQAYILFDFTQVLLFKKKNNENIIINIKNIDNVLLQILKIVMINIFVLKMNKCIYE